MAPQPTVCHGLAVETIKENKHLGLAQTAIPVGRGTGEAPVIGGQAGLDGVAGERMSSASKC